MIDPNDHNTVYAGTGDLSPDGKTLTSISDEGGWLAAWIDPRYRRPGLGRHPGLQRRDLAADPRK